MNLVSDAVDQADFMDLLIPTYIVGVDLLKGEEVLFETGACKCTGTERS
jgi:NTE family protein